MTRVTPTAEESLPLVAVQRALRKTTEVLAHELGHPGDAVPDWSQTEWRIARAVAAIHGVSGLLARHLRWQGPACWMNFLEEQRTQIAQRQARIHQLLQMIDTHSGAQGIALVALKGAALHAQGRYGAGERPMADVDLLVADSQVEAASSLLRGLGFEAGAISRRHRTFLPSDGAPIGSALGEHSTNPIKIELHTCVSEILPLRAVDLTTLVFPRAPHAGINDYASRAGLTLHVLLHAAGAIVDRSARLLHLNDISRLTQPLGAGDWEELFHAAAGTADASLWWAYPPLALTQRYYGGVPSAVLERLAGACQWTLRRAYRERVLSDVSLSYLWVSAFPGIEWSRSLREMAAYAAVRVWPHPHTVAQRRVAAESQDLLNGGEWAYASQPRRIVRWLLARQPRQQSLQPVRAALAPASS